MQEKLLQQILNEVMGLKTGFDELKAEVNGLKDEVNGLKTEVNGIKKEVADLKHEQQITNERLTRIEDRQKAIYEQTGKLTVYHTETISRIDRLQTDVEFTYKKTAQHDLQINRLENAPPQSQQ